MTDDLSLLIQAAEGASTIARRFFRDGHETWTKADKSPVTEADIAVDTYLRDTLLDARPEYGWMSEETPDDPEHRNTDVAFIVDPIDGTRAFASGERSWAHSLAIARDGEVTEAVIQLPLRDKLYTASLGQGAFLNGARISVGNHTDPDGATLLASRPITEPVHWSSPAPQFHRHFRPALAYRLALVAEGRFDALLTLRAAWEWDIAAGTLLVTEAGGLATPPGKPPHRFNSAARQAPGFLAANPALHDAIAARLA